MTKRITPESRWWPACWRCFHGGRPRKVERFEWREQGSTVIFTAHCHGGTEECTVPLADARRMLGATDDAGPVFGAGSELVPGRAFPSIAFQPKTSSGPS